MANFQTALMPTFKIDIPFSGNDKYHLKNVVPMKSIS